MSAAAATIPAVWKPKVNPWLIALAVMSATFMEVLDSSVANVSLPHIGGTLSASTDEATWVLTSYLVSNAIILPATGWLSSFFGRKRLLITCIIIFTLASALCGAANSLGVLIFARVLQGLGGGVLQPTAQSVMMESFPVEKRGQAMAVYAMGVVVAPIIGPTLGGWITDNYSWRWIFYINIPVGIFAVLMARAYIEDPPYLNRNVRNQIDYIGFSLMAIFLGTAQIILDKGQQEDWFSSSLICWLTVLCLATFVGFIYQELHTPEPIVNLRIFRDRNFSTAMVMMTVVGAALYSTIAILPMFLQTLMGYSSVQSGLAVSPRGIGSFVSMIIVGRIVSKFDARLLISVGFAMLALSVYWLSGINLEVAQSNIIWPNILNGFSMGFIFIPMSTMSLRTLRPEQMNNGTGISSLMRNLGGGIGISAATTMLARGAQIHQAQLVQHMTPYDQPFQQRVQEFQSLMHAPLQQTYAFLYGTMLKQSLLLSFIDIFKVLALMCLICIPLTFLFKKPKGQAGGGDTAMH